MRNLQKLGGIAALYMALAYLMGIVLFLFVLDYPSMVDPAQRVSLLVNNQIIIYVTNLMLYVIFGIFLIVFCLALYERLKASTPAMMQVATVIGIIWAGSLSLAGLYWFLRNFRDQGGLEDLRTALQRGWRECFHGRCG